MSPISGMDCSCKNFRLFLAKDKVALELGKSQSLQWLNRGLEDEPKNTGGLLIAVAGSQAPGAQSHRSSVHALPSSAVAQSASQSLPPVVAENSQLVGVSSQKM